MEEKRYSFIGSIINLINAIRTSGSVDDGKVSLSNLSDVNERKFVDKLIKKSEEFAKNLQKSLDGVANRVRANGIVESVDVKTVNTVPNIAEPQQSYEEERTH